MLIRFLPHGHDGHGGGRDHGGHDDGGRDGSYSSPIPINSWILHGSIAGQVKNSSNFMRHSGKKFNQSQILG